MLVDMSKHFSIGALIKYSIPSIAMMIFTSIYGIVDGIFVSNFVGKTAFAAVNLILPYVMILSVTGFMIGTGGSALVSKTRGEGKEKLANEYFSMLVIFTFALGVILAVVGFFTMEPVALFLGANEGMLSYCVLYGQLLLISLPFYSLQFAFQSFFVTAGKPTLGFLVIVIAGVSNIVLDFVFIAWLNWGLVGAALATVVGEILGGGLPIIYFARKNASYLRLIPTKMDWHAISRSCVNGSSEMVTNIAVSVVSMVYNFQLMSYIGEEGVAAYGVIMYTFLVFSAIFMGYNIGTSPLLSFQYGAQNKVEMRSILMRSIGFAWVAGAAMLVLAQLLAEPIAYIFTGYDQQLFEITVHGYRIFAICFLFMGYSMYGSAFFTALNNGLVSAFMSFLRTLILETISVIFLPMVIGVDGIWFSVTVAEVFSVAMTSAFIFGYRNRYGYGKRAIRENKTMLSMR